ncbi:phage protein Gp27 family protein [Sphingobium lignivorans]|uniref:DUF3486 family protein n=1 Tax=Sphingobium lignivorans TaxID=2735886 RepID=A0ABR6NJF6_9SPHN|nr:hypothetical protein [Sphingobium lignivorans]
MGGDRRDGRGRLSSVDMLPEEAEPDIVWAMEQLRERQMPSNAILSEFNARLADRGIAGISKSAWGRYAIRKALQFRKQDEVRRISGDLVASLGTKGADELTVMVGEMIKLRLFELLEGGALDAKGSMEAARALQSSVNAQKASAEHRRRLEEMRKQVTEAIDKVADSAPGVDAEQLLKRIREDVYGIFQK